jgi:hypothetical protein
MQLEISNDVDMFLSSGNNTRRSNGFFLYLSRHRTRPVPFQCDD